MTISNIILRALKKVVGFLEKENIDFCLFGGLAMQAYKRIRATKDIDLMVVAAPGNTLEFIGKMQEAGFIFDKKRGVIKINGFELLRFIYTDSETDFDIFVDIVTAATEFQRQILSRKAKIDFFGTKINIARLEDIILLKLLADRPIDILDAQVLLEENRRDIDTAYLKNWAKRLGLQKGLEGILKKNA